MHVKNIWQRAKPVVIACAATLTVYLFTATVLAAIMENNIGIFTIVASIVYAAVFCYFYIYFRDYKKVETNSLFSMYKNKGFNILGDLKIIILTEWKTLLVFSGINMICWLLRFVDKLLFGDKTLISAILLVFAPMNMIGEILPKWGNSILGYVVGSLIICVVYIPMLAVFRMKWSK